MFRNYLVTTFRNLERNRLYAAITILGLAVAFTAAILVAQFVRGEFSYDHWIPGYQQVYKITSVVQQPGQPPIHDDINPPALAPQLTAALPINAAVARLRVYILSVKHRPGDAAVADRSFAWADPDVFKVLPLPVLAGNLASALQQPDTVVITRSAARKYFHRDLPIGDTLLVKTGDLRAPEGKVWHPMRVTAVLNDLPSNTNLTTEMFGSARSAYSDLAWMDTQPRLWGGLHLHLCKGSAQDVGYGPR
jgi:putative ABC transport system permease protein